MKSSLTKKYLIVNYITVIYGGIHYTLCSTAIYFLHVTLEAETI
jgi:hypothetical protein